MPEDEVLHRPCGEQLKLVSEKKKTNKKKSGEHPHRRTKWSPQAKWGNPTDVTGGESRRAPAQEDQVVSSGQVATPPMSVVEKVGELPHRRTKWAPHAKWQPPAQEAQWSPQGQVASHEKVGVLPHRRTKWSPPRWFTAGRVPSSGTNVRCVPRWLSRWSQAGEVPRQWDQCPSRASGLCATMDCGGCQQVRGVPREH